jgi:hypothetical protein
MLVRLQEEFMKSNNAKFGWMLALAGFLLLLMLDNFSLLLLVVPAAAVLACGFLFLGQKHGNVTHGLK